MNVKQIEIYKGLKAIGPEIAQFYEDGVKLMDLEIGSKSYLLGHLAREIDGGLRNIFEQKQKKEEFMKLLNNEQLQLLFDEFKRDYEKFDYLKDITFKDFKESKGHISSIIVAFGFPLDSPISKEYIKITRWLNKYAHRSGAFNNPRNPNDIIQFWKEFEDVLSKLIGNYYAIADRLDLILEMDEPTNEIIKTLPNLLNIESRFVYFFSKLKSIKWLKALYENNYFVGRANPEPKEVDDNPGYFTIPYWSVLQYLEVVSVQNFEKSNKEISKLLISIIDEIINYRKDNGDRIENYHTDYAIFKVISNLPNELIIKEYFKFIEIALNNRWDGLIAMDYGKIFIERFVKDDDKEKILLAVNLLISYRLLDDNVPDRVISLFKEYELTRILDEYKLALIEKCGIDLLNLALEKVNEIIVADKSSFNNITLPTIENHEQTFAPEKFECQLIYLIRDCLGKLSPDETKGIIEILLKKQHPIFHRLSVYTINFHYDRLSELFWNWSDNPLNYSLVKHEIFELLKANSKNFTVKEIAQLLHWIETKEYFIPDEYKDNEDIIEKSIAYRKKEWLVSLLNANNNDVNKAFDKYNSINQSEIRHPGFDFWHESLSGTISPISVEEILKYSLNDLVGYFERYSAESHSFMGPSLDGLSDAIILAVRRNPEIFIKDCKPIIQASTYFKYTWIRGLHECWRDENKLFDCSNILQTIKDEISVIKFWDELDKYKEWYISNVISFIEDGVRNDTHAIGANQLPIIKEILLLILENDTTKVHDYQELSMTALNNSRGKIFYALIEFSLRVARVEKKEIDRWDTDIKLIFEKLLNDKKEIPLFYHAIGRFLPNIQYLNESWLVDNFKKIFLNKFDGNWSAAFSGYLFFNSTPSKFFFSLFYKNGIFLKAISYEFKNERSGILSNLVNHILIGYSYELNDFTVNDEIIEQILKVKSKSIFQHIIHFFWSPRFTIDARIVHKIKPLWHKFFQASKDIANPELDGYILSGCINWINSLNSIDNDVYEWIIYSIPYIGKHDKYSIFESLTKHINNETEKVAKILVRLFEEEVTYDISRGKIKDMVEIIYQSDYKEYADKICLLHGEKGLHFMRELFIKYNA